MLSKGNAFVAEKCSWNRLIVRLMPCAFSGRPPSLVDFAYRVDDEVSVAVHASGVASGAIAFFADNGDNEPFAEGAQFTGLLRRPCFFLAWGNGHDGGLSRQAPAQTMRGSGMGDDETATPAVPIAGA